MSRVSLVLFSLVATGLIGATSFSLAAAPSIVETMPAAGHPAEEARLAAAGLSTVRGYLRYWERHNREVIAAVPAERLLILRLDELDTAQESLAEFLGIAADSLPQSEVRINTRKAKEIELEDLGIDYVKQIARQECGELMERFFPGTQLK